MPKSSDTHDPDQLEMQKQQDRRNIASLIISAASLILAIAAFYFSLVSQKQGAAPNVQLEQVESSSNFGVNINDQGTAIGNYANIWATIDIENYGAASVQISAIEWEALPSIGNDKIMDHFLISDSLDLRKSRNVAILDLMGATGNPMIGISDATIPPGSRKKLQEIFNRSDYTNTSTKDVQLKITFTFSNGTQLSVRPQVAYPTPKVPKAGPSP
jgi:hypothetical protein